MDRRLSEIKVGKSVIIKSFEKDDIFSTGDLSVSVTETMAAAG